MAVILSLCMRCRKFIAGVPFAVLCVSGISYANIVGKPMAALLLAMNAIVTIAHSRLSNLPELCGRADIVVAAMGRPEALRGEWLKPGAVVLDVGAK